MGMTNGKVIDNGDAKVLHVVVQHGIHVVKTVFWMLVFGEMANYNTSDM